MVLGICGHSTECAQGGSPTLHEMFISSRNEAVNMTGSAQPDAAGSGFLVFRNPAVRCSMRVLRQSDSKYDAGDSYGRAENRRKNPNSHSFLSTKQEITPLAEMQPASEIRPIVCPWKSPTARLATLIFSGKPAASLASARF